MTGALSVWSLWNRPSATAQVGLQPAQPARSPSLLRSAEHGFSSPLRSAEHPFSSSWRSAGHGFAPSLRSAEHGFTLVEMLIALAIFAMLSVAGVMMLRSSIDTQQAIAARLDGEGGLSRLRAMLGTELSSAQPRIRRDGAGQRLPALVGDSGQIDFIYATQGEPGAPAIARARYALNGGNLVRQGSPHADGDLSGEGAIILSDVRSLRWRYRLADGSWADSWRADDAARLPRAVELVVDSAAAPDLTLHLLVAPDGVPGRTEPAA